jgi:hypothetical protein
VALAVPATAAPTTASLPGLAVVFMLIQLVLFGAAGVVAATAPAAVVAISVVAAPMSVVAALLTAAPVATTLTVALAAAVGIAVTARAAAVPRAA